MPQAQRVQAASEQVSSQAEQVSSQVLQASAVRGGAKYSTKAKKGSTVNTTALALFGAGAGLLLLFTELEQILEARVALHCFSPC
jgi:hypothetical protein